MCAYGRSKALPYLWDGISRSILNLFIFTLKDTNMAFMKDSPEMRLNSLSLYCSTQNEWHYSEAGETEKSTSPWFRTRCWLDWTESLATSLALAVLAKVIPLETSHPRLHLRTGPGFSFVFYPANAALPLQHLDQWDLPELINPLQYILTPNVACGHLFRTPLCLYLTEFSFWWFVGYIGMWGSVTCLWLFKGGYHFVSAVYCAWLHWWQSGAGWYDLKSISPISGFYLNYDYWLITLVLFSFWTMDVFASVIVVMIPLVALHVCLLLFGCGDRRDPIGDMVHLSIITKIRDIFNIPWMGIWPEGPTWALY